MTAPPSVPSRSIPPRPPRHPSDDAARRVAFEALGWLAFFVVVFLTAVFAYACAGCGGAVDRPVAGPGGGAGGLGGQGGDSGVGGELDAQGGAGGAGGAPCEPWQDCACDDGDPCTLDTHPPGYCEHVWACGGSGLGGEGGA